MATRRERILRESPFAVRFVRRAAGEAAIIYRRHGDKKGRDRLQRVATLSPLALTAARPLLREAVAKSGLNGKADLSPGTFKALSADWGARVACFGLLAAGLRDGDRLARAAGHLRSADGNEASWWLGMLTRADDVRALRALRILTEAVE